MKLKQVGIKKSRIEMIPIVDSFFLILVYFIYAFLSMSLHRGVPLQLPTASTAIEEKITHHGISINETGDFFWDKEPVSKEVLEQKLKDAKQNTPKDELAIYIYGDKNAGHGVVVSVLDLLRQIGIARVFIETEPGMGDEA